VGNPLRAVNKQGIGIGIAGVAMEWRDRWSCQGETRTEQRYYGSRHSARLVLKVKELGFFQFHPKLQHLMRIWKHPVPPYRISGVKCLHNFVV
jgi:hypothetical protein